MKKVFCLVITTILIAAFLLPVVEAKASSFTQEQTDIIYLKDGYYVTIERTEQTERASSTKRGSKSYIYRDSTGAELWRATVYGTFTYTGTSVTCTAASCSTTITNTAWYEVSNSASPSGGSATAEVTMGQKLIGITIKKETISMRLTCDANGNLS